MTQSALRARNSRRASRAEPAAQPRVPWNWPPPPRARTTLARRLLVTADLAGPALAFAFSSLLVGGASIRSFAVFVAVLPAWGIAAQIAGLYDQDAGPEPSTANEPARIIGVVTVCIWCYVLTASFAGALEWSARRLTVLWLVAIVLVTLGRALMRGIARRRPAFRERAIVLGTGDAGRLVVRKLQRHPEFGIAPVGFVDARRSHAQAIEGMPILGTPERLPELIDALEVDRIIVAVPADEEGALLALVHRLRARSVQVDVVPTLFEATDPRSTLRLLETLPLLSLAPVRHGGVGRVCKRVIDVIVASTALVAVSPILAVVAWRVKRDSPGPVFFRQTRLGLHMRPFTALKFRTMWTDVDDTSHRDYIRSTMTAQASVEGNGLYKLERHDDVTPFGRFLRRWSIDELPQLINVVRGDMSLVGPRPCIPYETENFAPHHFDRFLVPAGVTGLWQVAARARATFGEQMEMDVAYARGWSLALDMRLLCRTPFAVLRQTATA